MKKVWAHYLFKDLLGLILVFLTIFIILANFGGGGTIGNDLNFFVENTFGFSKYFITLFIALLGVLIILDIKPLKKIKWLISCSLFLISIITYLAFFKNGGEVGNFIIFFQESIGKTGLLLLMVLFDLVAIILLFGKSIIELVKSLRGSGLKGLKLPDIKIFGADTKLEPEPTNPEPTKPETQFEPRINSFIKKGDKNAKPLEDIKLKKLPLKTNYTLPPITLLEKKDEVPESGDIRNNIQIIKRTLSNFGISVEVEEITIGPTITRYGIKLAEGVKISKILALQNDLALNLAAHSIRMEAPIAGKSLVGIEMPNQKIAKVRLRNLVEEPEFFDNESLLHFPVGRMVAGESFFSDLALMPHLIIAGTTGSGKSMFIHSLILSLLLKNTPETLNFILVDPKRVELIRYENIPHLLMEPVLDPKKVVNVMQWLIREMEERFLLFQENKVRDLYSYNKLMISKKQNHMPRIVLIIDEMADLMLSHGAAIESSIVRLTQMARATGIHLVLATQRPSVDVVTGLIKANIPNRICFKVASQIDSRTVLDFGGAEKLLGSGDMLFVSTRFMGTKRIQAPLASEKEMLNITDYWKEQSGDEIEYPIDFMKKIDINKLESKELGGRDDGDDDELMQEAYRLIVSTGKASTSFLQRKLRVGYARAARILDALEEKGVVSEAEGTKPRKVLLENLENFEE
ncbi:MAG: DNA translocase FtsK [Patescibacteria group bacterium]